MYDNKYKVNGAEFEYSILKNNERCNIPIEPKNSSCHEYLSVVLLDSILIYPESYCSNKYCPQNIFKKINIHKRLLLGNYIHY